MEFAAAKLACGDEMPVMIIEGGQAVGLLQPVRHVQAALSRGAFSVDDDRTVVNKTLASMLRARRVFAALGDVTLSRLVFVFRPVFVDAEYVDALDADTPADRRVRQYKPAAETAVDRLKRRLAWRGDSEEAAWEKETGFNLLTRGGIGRHGGGGRAPRRRRRRGVPRRAVPKCADEGVRAAPPPAVPAALLRLRRGDDAARRR